MAWIRPPAATSQPGDHAPPSATTVAPGDGFDVKFRVRNPNEGTVAGLTIVPRFGGDPGVEYNFAVLRAGSGSGPPPGGALQFTTGPLGPGGVAEFSLHSTVGPSSGPGAIRLGAAATGHYGDGPQAVPAAGSVDVVGPQVTAALNGSGPPGGPITKNPVGGKAVATAGASSPAGSGGRKPVRASAGVAGAAGSAASAAPVTPAPTTPPPTPPVPATEPTPPVTVPTPTQAPPPPAGRAAIPALKGNSARHERRPWVGAATVLLLAVAAGVLARLSSARR